MKPILFPADAMDFDTLGLGVLRDASKCTVTEERNGVYELYMTYSMYGQHYKEIQNECIILAKPNNYSDPQPFVISNIVDNLDGTVEITAEHISYRASYIPVSPFVATGISDAIDGINEHLMDYCPFTIWTDIENTETRYEQNIQKSLRACLGGSEGSFLDVFGSRGTGEYEWDIFDIKFHYHRGSDRGYTIRYGKNISDFSNEHDSSEIVTGCLAYWIDPDSGNCYYGDIQRNSLYQTYPIEKTALVDTSDVFESIPTRSQLNDYALAYAEELSVLKEKTSVEIYDPDGENIALCDTVSVRCDIISGLNIIKTINYQAKVIKTVYDVLAEKYTKITIGDNISDLASTLADMNEEAVAAANAATDNKIVSVYQHVDYELGEIVDQIGSVEESIITSNGVNYAPFFNHPLDDIYEEREYETGYWRESIIDEDLSISQPNIEAGWANAEIYTATTEQTFTFWPSPEPVIEDDEATLLVEIRNFERSAGSNPYIQFEDSSTYNGNTIYAQFILDSTIEISEDVVYYCTIQKQELNGVDPFALTLSSIVFPAGFVGSFDIRLSVYKPDYTGTYMPYIKDYTEIYDSFYAVSDRITNLNSRFEVTEQNVNSLVTYNDTIEETIRNIANKEAEEVFTTKSSSYYSYVDQTAYGINTVIGQVQQTTNSNKEIIDKYEKYITISQSDDGITIGRSNSNIRGKFDNDSLDFINQYNTALAWLSVADGLGANMLSVGNSTTKSQRWNMVTSNDGNYIRFTRHQ